MRLTVLAALGLLAALTSCFGPPPGKGPRAEAGYHGATPIIGALDRFHHDRGHYPAKLAELVPRYIRDPALFDLRRGRERLYPDVGAGFSYTREDDSYTLRFAYSGPGMNRCWYDSKTKKWESIGYY